MSFLRRKLRNLTDRGTPATGDILHLWSSITGKDHFITVQKLVDEKIAQQLEGLKWKAAVRMATTAGITLSGLQTIDGVVGVADDRVLVKNQGTQSENGIYLMKSGAWVRTDDGNVSSELHSAIVPVGPEGTSNKNTAWRQTTANPVIGSSNVVWEQFGAGGNDTTSTVNVSGAVFIDSTGLGRVHICSGTSANYTVTLTVSAVGNAGKIIAFKGSPALTRFVTIDASGSETIDGALTKVIWAQEYFAMVSDGANWIVFAQHARPLQCRMRLSANQTGVSNGLAANKININQADVDNSLRMADAIAYRINIPRSGNYNVRVMCFINDASATFGRFIAAAFKNGVTSTSVLSGETNIVINSFKGANGAANVALTAGDYLELYVFHNSGSATETIFGSLSAGSYTGIDVIEIV